MPVGWEPRPQELQKATRMGLSASLERERFIDHHTAKGSVFADWDAAFRTWLGNSQRWAQGTANGHRPAQPTLRILASKDDDR